MSIYITYLQSHVQYKSCLFQGGLSLLISSRLWRYVLVKARLPSQDVVDGPGAGALRCAGLRVGAAGREGRLVPQRRRSAAGLRRGGQTVHDAGETLQTGSTGCFIAQTIW